MAANAPALKASPTSPLVDAATAARGRLATSPAQLAGAIALSVLGGLAVAVIGDPVIVAGLFIGAAFVLVGMVAPALFLSLLLLLRPLLDGPTGGGLGAVPSVNAAGAVGMVAVAVAVVLLVGRPQFVDPRVTLALAALIAVSAMASVQALTEFGDTIGLEPISELARLGALLAIYLIAENIFGDEKGVRRLLLIVAVSATLPSLVGLYQLVSGPDAVAGYDIGRINGTFGGPLPFSFFLAMATLILTQLPREMMPTAARVSLLTLYGVALVGTYSREGWLVLILGLILLEWRRRKVLLVGVGLLCALVVALVPNVQQRVIPSGDSSDRNAAESSLSWRLDNWDGLLEKYAERPLTGWGLRSTGYVNPRAPVNAPPEGGGYDAHNTGVRALLEGGPALLLAYIAVFAAILLSLRAVVRDERSAVKPYARVVYVLWIAVLAVAVASDDPFEATATMYALLALTGAVLAAHRARLDRPR